MARSSSQDRSLVIISKMNGWDPTKIEGGPPLGQAHVYQEDRVHKGDGAVAPGGDADPLSYPTVSPPAVQGEAKPTHTTGADPFPGMPGARGKG
jgi:hypothetical protein